MKEVLPELNIVGNLEESIEALSPNELGILSFEIFILIFSLVLIIWSLRNIKVAKKFYNNSHELLGETTNLVKDWEKEFNRSAGDIVGSSLVENFKQIPRYNELSGKHEWYLFNLQSVVFYIRDNKDNPEVFKDFDTFVVLESIAIAWCKTSDGVFKDFIIISEYYNPKEEKEEKEEKEKNEYGKN